MTTETILTMDDKRRIMDSNMLPWHPQVVAAINDAEQAVLQSQDREDAERINFIEANPGWLRVSRLGHRTKQMWACVSPFTNYEYDLFKTAREAIDHARHVEEEGE